MKPASRRLGVVASLALLAGCGGSSSGSAALSKSFTYGPPQAPTQTEQSAATSAQAGMSDAATFSATPDATKGAAIIGIADALSAAALGSPTVGLAAPSSQEIAHAIRRADISTCATVTATSVTFNSCSESAGGFAFTLNGSISSAAAGAVTWNITGGFAGTSNGDVLNLTLHQSGSLTVTASTVIGNATSDFGGSISVPAQNVSASFGLSTAAVINLTYQTAPSYCITAGSVEVKRVWTQLPSGASSAPGSVYADAGIKISWTACNAFQVAHSQ